MKKSFKLIILFMAAVFLLTACGKPNANDLADKINLDYRVLLSEIGGEGKYKEFSAESTLEYSGENVAYIEEYIVKYNEKLGKPNAYVKISASDELGVFVPAAREVKFFDTLAQRYTITNGVVEKEGDPNYPDRLMPEGSSRLDDFKAQYMRLAMPAEIFVDTQLDNLKAVKKSNRTVVTATAKTDALASICEQYNRGFVGAPSLDTVQYTGTQKLYQFDSVEYEYSIQKGRIANKRITIKGKGRIKTGDTFSNINLTVIHTVLYNYSVNMAAPSF